MVILMERSDNDDGEGASATEQLVMERSDIT